MSFRVSLRGISGVIVLGGSLVISGCGSGIVPLTSGSALPTSPAPTNPAPTNPAPTNPAPTDPTPTDPTPTNPVPTNPAPTDPTPTNPAPTNPAPTDPAPTNPAPTDPTPTNPAPTDPTPTDPTPTNPTTPSTSGFSGSLYGGQQPISGAIVTMYAAGTSGYGTGATSILNGSGSVTTASDGTFSISSGYTCPSSSSQVYLIATGGNVGTGVNNNAILMAALGNCGDIDASTFVSINEVSSVASVYALAQFMTPGSTAVGTSSTNITGLVNAFRAVANITNIAKGTALSTTPAGNGIVPASTINSLANIMEACVDTTGANSACTNLFSAATPPGGTAPTDTLSAMLDIARNPGNNVATLFQIAPAKGLFQPSLSGAPNDWTLSIEYTGGGLKAPQLPAIDASGNIWVPNAVDPGTLSQFSPLGEPLAGANGFGGGGLSYPEAVAVDLNGNVWTANEGVSSVSEHTAGGTALSGTKGFMAAGLSTQYAIALDSAGNVFTANSNSSVTKLNAAGTSIGQFINGGLNVAYSLAIDSVQNIWIANAGPLLTPGDSISKFSNTGTAASVSGFTGGGLNGPVSIAIDASGNAWAGNFNNPSVSKLSSAGTPLSGAGYTTPSFVSGIAVDGSNTIWTANTDGSISHLSNSGTAISPATGYLAPAATGEVGIAIDASGNIWTTDAWPNGSGQYSLFEYIGAAGPTAVPLQQSLKNNLLGKKP